MNTPITLPGTLKPDGTLELSQKVNLPPGPVSITVVPVGTSVAPVPISPAPQRHGLAEVIDAIRQNQQARGLQGRSAQEIEAGLREGEDEYEQRMQAHQSQTKSGQVGGS